MTNNTDPTNSCLSATNINWHINNAAILKDINLDLKSGEVLGVIGPNGAGKSSLLKVLANVVKPTSGTIKLHGSPYNSIDAKAFAQQLGYLEQNAPVHWPLLVS